MEKKLRENEIWLKNYHILTVIKMLENCLNASNLQKHPKFLLKNIYMILWDLRALQTRQLIALLKNLGFLDNTGKPTEFLYQFQQFAQRYSSLKNEKIAKQEIAQGIREAYAPLFTANENAETLNQQDLKCPLFLM